MRRIRPPGRGALEVRFAVALVAGLAGCRQDEPLGGSPPAPATLPGFSLTELGVLAGGTQSQANSGTATQIVGWATDAAGRRHAVRFVGGSAIRLAEPPGATSSEA